jgi:uncharacterized protein with FMN-binding domain
MRRITLWVFCTVAALVLLFSYRTSTDAASATAATRGTAAATDSAEKTYVGELAQVKWGPVQVAVVMSGGRITEVQVLQHPTGNKKDEQVNGMALPRLREETLAAQSADIDTVSGATFTSDGYRRSLQSALDAAHRN